MLEKSISVELGDYRHRTTWPNKLVLSLTLFLWRFWLDSVVDHQPQTLCILPNKLGVNEWAIFLSKAYAKLELTTSIKIQLASFSWTKLQACLKRLFCAQYRTTWWMKIWPKLHSLEQISFSAEQMSHVRSRNYFLCQTKFTSKYPPPPKKKKRWC